MVTSSSATNEATDSSTCSQLSSTSRVGAVSSSAEIRLRTSASWAGGERTPPGHRTPDAQGRTHLGDDVVAGGHADQLHEVHAGLGRLAGEHVRDPGLAEPARADDGDQPAATDGRPQLVEVGLAAEERVGLEVHAVAHRAVGDQQLAVQPLQGRVRVDAEAVGQVGPVLLVALQRRRRSGGGRDAAQQRGGDGDVVDRGGVRLLQVGERLLVAAGGREGQAEHPPDPATVVGGVLPQLGQRPVDAVGPPTSRAAARPASSTAAAASPVSRAAPASRVSRRSSNASTSSAGTPSR